MSLDTATLTTIGTTVAGQIKNEIVAGIQEAGAQLTATDRAEILNAVEQIGLLAARQYAGEDVSAELAQWKSVITQYEDVVALIAKRVTRERLAAIGEEVAAAALKAGEVVLRGLVPI